MKNYFKYFGWKSLVAVAAVLAVVTFLVPKLGARARSEYCENPPTVATMNPYAKSYGGIRETCHDDITLQFFSPGGHYPSQDEMNAGMNPTAAGQEFYVMGYAHNGAAQNLDPNQTTARNVEARFNVSDSNVSVSVAGSNTNTDYGSFGVHLPAGHHLEVVEGSGQIIDGNGGGAGGYFDYNGSSVTAHFGDIEACFEHLRYARFKVRVVADQTQAPQNPEGSITAQQGGQIAGQCLRNGSVTWTTSNVQNPKVYVKDMSTGTENLMAAQDSGTAETPWLGPDVTYVFTLRGDNGFEKSTTIHVDSLNCGNVTPQNPTGRIWFDLGGKVSGQCLRNGVVHWETSNVQNPKVYVFDPITYQDKLMSASDNGSMETPWLEPNYGYIFKLRGDNFTEQTVASGVISRDGLDNCSTNPAPQTPSGTISVTVGDRSGSQCLRNGTVVWTTSNVTNPKVYVINVDTNQEQLVSYADSGNQQINWLQPGKNYTFILRGDNNFEKRYSTGAIPSLDCGSSPAPTLSCVGSPSSVQVGQTVVFSVTGGSNSFNWSIPEKENFSVQGSGLVGKFNTAGTKTATVTSGTLTASCSVNVTTTSQQELNNAICENVTIPASVAAGQSFQATVRMRNTGTKTWTQPWYSLGSQSPQDTNRWGTTRVAIPGIVAPNQTVTFTVNATAPSTAGNHAFDWKMVQDGVEWFGQTCASMVTVSAPQTTNTNNVCSNNTNTSNSCNQTNNNTQTSTGTNSPNQNNNSNINGNNNTVTQTNNNCVNNSCNGATTYYVTTTGATVSANEYRNLSIDKQVRSMNGSFANSVNVSNGDTVEFQIRVTNTGNQTVNNVRLSDTLPGGMTYNSGTVWMDSGYSSDSFFYGGNMNLGNLSAGASRTVRFQARINYNNASSLQNIAYASGDNVSQVQDDAWVFVGNVAGGNVNMQFSKKAWNDTKGVDAQSVNAVKEDFITYTLTVSNSGNTPANSFVITDDLSQVLPYADMVDNGGGTVSGNVISFPSITVPAGGSVSKSFKVRVKYFLASNLSYQMTNTYGNTVTIRINQPQVQGAFIAPKTGADSMALAFGGMMTAVFAVFKKRKAVLDLILAN